MDALLLLQLSAGFAVVPPRVHREQPAQRYVPINAYWIEVSVARHFGLGCQGDQEITSQQQRPAADTSVAASPGSLKASSKSHNERLNLHPNTNSGPLNEMKGVCTHIPTHTHTKCPGGKLRCFLQSAAVFRSPFSWFLARRQNWVILIMQPCSLYLSLFLLSALCSPLFLHLRVVATRSNSETGVRGERSLKAGTKVWSFDALPCLYRTTRVRSALLPFGSWCRQEVTSGPTGFFSRAPAEQRGQVLRRWGKQQREQLFYAFSTEKRTRTMKWNSIDLINNRWLIVFMQVV